MTDGIGAQPVHDRPTRVETAPGCFRDLDAESRTAAIQALGATDAPIARADELAAAVAGPALKAIVAMRVEQIVTRGHSALADLEVEPYRLLDKAVEMMRVARSRCGVTDMNAASLAAARKTAAKACALGMAVIDRIDAELARGERK
jgi:hypothetical protein